MDSHLVTQGFAQGLAQRQGHIFHRMVTVYIKVPGRPYGQVKMTVNGKKGQHMVQETHTCIDISFPRAVKFQGHCHVSFLRPAMDSTVSHDHPSRISFTASMMRAFSSKVPVEIRRAPGSSGCWE